MDAEWVADGSGYRHYAGNAAQLALTVTLAAAAVWGAVSFADRDDSPAGLAASPAPTVPAPPAHEVVLSTSAPESAYFFIVGSEAARAALMGSLEGESVVRAVVGQALRVAWVAIAATDAEAAVIEEAVNQDTATHMLGAPPIEVVDLR